MGKDYLKNKCRTCFHGTKGLQLLINKRKGETKSYGELLKDLTHIDLMNKTFNIMPQNICQCCIRKLKAAYAFIQQVQEVNDKLWSLLNETDIIEEIPMDCLQESQIDVESCTDIKVEDDYEEESSQESRNYELEIKFEVPENQNDESGTNVQKNIISEDIVSEDILKSKYESMSEYEDDFDAVDSLDNNSLQPDEEFSNSDGELVTSNDSSWGYETSYTKLKEDDCEIKRSIPPNTVNHNKQNIISTPCNQCNRVFHNSRLLRRHIRYTHVPEHLKVSCPYCQSKYSRRDNMVAHMKMFHKDKPFEEHLIQQRKRPQQYACELCDGIYTNKYYLRTHMKIKHGPTREKKKPERILVQKKRFLCTFCGGKFASQCYLDIHIRRHTGERPFKCDICNGAFYCASDVKIHRRTHTGEKPFKCTTCEKAFSRSNKLKVHIRTHSNERPYKCDVCEKAFKQSNDLTIHRRIHTGERPYVCGVCHSTFTKSTSLKLHQTKQQHFAVADKQPQSQPTDFFTLLME